MANCWVGRHVSDPVSSIFSLSPTLALVEPCVSSAKKSLKIWTIDTWKYTKILQTKKLNLFESLYDCFWEGDFLWKKYLFQQ